MPPESKIKKILKVYKDRVSWIEAFVEFVDNYNNSVHRGELQSQLQALEETKRSYEDAREKLLFEDEEIDGILMQNERKEFYKKYHKVRGFIMDLQRTDESAHPIANSTMANTTSAKLPEVAKLQYLLASLKGEAALQFEHVPLEEKSYMPTWETLLQRYDDNKILRREYFKALIQLEPMNAGKSAELTRVVNETRRLVQGMKRLDEPIQHWNTPLTTLVTYKLDKTTLMSWENFAVENLTDCYEHCWSSAKNGFVTALHSVGVIGKRAASKLFQRSRDQSRPENEQNTANIFCNVCSSSRNDKEACPASKADHPLDNCTKFDGMSILQREALAKNQRLCFRSSSITKSPNKVLSECYDVHHTLLCKRAAQESAEKVSQSTAAEQEAATINDTTRASGEPQRMVWLSTAVVLIRGSDGEELPARALLDQGSQSNFITERLAQQLKLKRVRISSPLSGIDDTVPIVSSSMVVTRIRSRVSEFQVSLQFLVLLRVTSDYPSRMVEVKRWNLPLGIPLADPAFNKPERIDMLIGARLFADLLQEGRIKLASYLPQLLETRLGWIVSGRLSKPTKDGFNESIVGCAMDDNFNAAMERLVQLEDIPEEKLMSDEEQLCERWYAETTRRNEDGRYIVQLPKMVANIFMQQLWRLKYVNGNSWPWDKELPESLCREWMNLANEFHVLQDVKLPRLVCASEAIQYHIFCDASEKRYRACIYVRSESTTGEVIVQLLISRSKVAPLAKRLTIARLELCAALLGSRLWDFVRKGRLREGPCFLWTDSMTTWHWIQSPHHLWKTFVGNRTAKIQLLTTGCIWRHVPGVENPADLISRGCQPSRLVASALWWSGPKWLSEAEDKWPDLPEVRAITSGEERKVELIVSSCSEDNFIDWLFDRFSSFTKLRLVVGYCQRFLQGVRTRLKKEAEKLESSVIHHDTLILTTEERLRSERLLCRLAQLQRFEKEIKCLDIIRSSTLKESSG
uniref:DUF1758 domain-containing protein n=1 Tax=Anopheles stephensi TaxID=30069 RepID=A0A182YRF4_ANOST